MTGKYQLGIFLRSIQGKEGFKEIENYKYEEMYTFFHEQNVLKKSVHPWPCCFHPFGPSASTIQDQEAC